MNSVLYSRIKALGQLYKPSNHKFNHNLCKNLTKSQDMLNDLYVGLAIPLNSISYSTYLLPIYDPYCMGFKDHFIAERGYSMQVGQRKKPTCQKELRSLFIELGSDFAKDDENKFLSKTVSLQVGIPLLDIAEMINQNYSSSIGGFCLFEEVSDDLLNVLKKGLSIHYPGIEKHPYFINCDITAQQHKDKTNKMIQELINARSKFADVNDPKIDWDVMISSEQMCKIIHTWWDILNEIVVAKPGQTIISWRDILQQ